MTKVISSVFCSIIIFLFVSIAPAQNDRSGIFDPENYGKLTESQMQAVINNLYFHLSKNPNWIGLIVLDYDEFETRREKIFRIKMIGKATTHRKYDASRLFVAIAQKARAHEYTILPGEKLFPLTPSEYKIFGLPILMKSPNIAFPTTKNNRPK